MIIVAVRWKTQVLENASYTSKTYHNDRCNWANKRKFKGRNKFMLICFIKPMNCLNASILLANNVKLEVVKLNMANNQYDKSKSNKNF